VEQYLQLSLEFECQSQMSLFRLLVLTFQETDVRKVRDWDSACVNLTHHINQGETIRDGYLQDSSSL
jgi:hypothetical protein